MTINTLDITDCINETCPWSGEPVQADSLTEYDGKVVGFCNPGCRDKFEAATRHFDEAKGARKREVANTAQDLPWQGLISSDGPAARDLDTELNRGWANDIAEDR